jgi:tetratricopeptide (TPR) repeat protein
MNERQKIALRLVLLLLVGSFFSFAPSAISVTQKIQNAQKAFEVEDYQLQGEILIDLVEENPWWKSLWASAGDAFFSAGNSIRAIPPYEKALELNSISESGMINLGASYRAAGDYSSAEAVWQIIEQSPEALARLADLYEENGDFPSAINAWDEYLSLEDDVQENVILKIALLLAADSPSDALLYLERCSTEYPQAAEIKAAIQSSLKEEESYQLLTSGQALAANGYWDLAAYAFEKASKIRPDYLEAYLYWGEALQHIPEADYDPLEILEQGLAQDVKSPLANMFLGLYWQRQGSHDLALDYFEIAEESWPDRPDIYVEQGRSLGALGELDMALEKFQKAIEISPIEGLYYQQLADFCVMYSYQIQEVGLPAARIAVQFNNQDPASLDSMGQVLMALNDQMNASQFFLRALEADPTFAPAFYHLGILFSARGDIDLAEYYLGQVMIHSTNSAIRDQVERMLSTY